MSMMTAAIVVLCFSLFMVLCVRHFFVQLLGIKLLLDVLVLLLCGARGAETNPVSAQTAAVFVSALSALVIFVLMAAGIQRFAKRQAQGNLEVKIE